ncbi:response regulator transcription factor [Actinospica durhamensis]|uniref:Response regulator transcription factor n=1 Tax=Actinospica durhamensis TaxID=1508375 RepID=A0A941EU58_9ACTN|nr:response regulator transcription factor [Actinospica durhamensis]MBR7837293.1 response regulator transcription factor [Actinospica durhamensis]
MRLLVVEDERELAAALRRGLGAEGFTVDLAYDGREGLWMARTGRYAAIVLDLMLPQPNGYKVCQTLRREGDETPILVLTAKDGDYDQAEALDTGADDYLTKPFSYVVLLARVRALLRRGRGGGSALLSVGDLVLDVAARSCRRAGTAVTLTPREFAVAEVLARRPGEVVSKSELLHHVWPDDVEDVNLVEASISRLRRKIDLAFERDSLRTVRGVGYRLVDDRAAL